MTRTDNKEGLRDYLKQSDGEIEIQALKLARIYRIDHHDLLSRTGQTIWQKWQLMSTLEDDVKRNHYSFGVLANHARNLSRLQRREWTECQPASHLLDCDATEGSGWRDPAVETLFKDQQFAIYRAISQLRGRSRDVMSLRALGLSNEEIRSELDLTSTNLATAFSRAIRELRLILDTGRHDEGGM